MNEEEFNLICDEILTENDPTKITSKLLQLKDAYKTSFSNATSLKASNEDLTKENERITKMNMELFLRTSQKTNGEAMEQEEQEEEEQEKRSFENLFDDKGEIK